MERTKYLCKICGLDLLETQNRIKIDRIFRIEANKNVFKAKCSFSNPDIWIHEDCWKKFKGCEK